MKETMVSVIMLTYNHEEYIAQAIESIVNQVTDFEFELIIHDDASTDKTAEIIKEYERIYPDIIKAICQKENKHSKGEKILEPYIRPEVTGKYIALCEGDDFWLDMNKLQKQYNFMESNCDYSACTTKTKQINCVSGEETEFPNIECSRDISTDEIIANGGGFIGTNSMFMRKEYYFDRTAPFFGKLIGVGDYPLLINISLCGKVYFINEVMGAYRFMHAGSWTTRNIGETNYVKREKHIYQLVSMLDVLDEFTNGKYKKTIKQTQDKNLRTLGILLGKYKNETQKRYKKSLASMSIVNKMAVIMRVNISKFKRR